MVALANRPTLPAPPTDPRPAGQLTDDTRAPRPTPPDVTGERTSFLLVLLRALGAMHT